MSNTNKSIPRSMGAGVATYVIFSIVFGIPLIIWIVAGIIRDPLVSLVPISIVITLWLGIIIWIKSFRVRLNEASIIYKSLFCREKSINYKDIINAKVTVGANGGIQRILKPFVSYDIETSKGEVLSINIKVFSAADVKDIIDTINIKLSGA